MADTKTWIEVAMYFASLVVACMVAFFALKEWAAKTGEHIKSIDTNVGQVSTKVDTILNTVGEIKTNAARHDERAQSIQQSVEETKGRVTRLENIQFGKGRHTA